MIIKANGAELEINDTSGVYLGLPKKGQIFKIEMSLVTIL